jgi:hypothetical protein
MAKKFSWAAPPLPPEDQQLLTVYERIGRPLDLLPYTEDFEKLIRELGKNPTDEEREKVYRRLLYLRKTARLPRPTSIIGVGTESMPLSAADQELVSAYQLIGSSLNSLPYTPDFERLLEELGKAKTQAIKIATFQRLLRLYKQGRLPHVSEPY